MFSSRFPILNQHCLMGRLMIFGTRKPEAERSQVEGLLGLQSKFKANLDNLVINKRKKDEGWGHLPLAQWLTSTNKTLGLVATVRVI